MGLAIAARPFRCGTRCGLNENYVKKMGDSAPKHPFSRVKTAPNTDVSFNLSLIKC
jgi:hypothetical protein